MHNEKQQGLFSRDRDYQRGAERAVKQVVADSGHFQETIRIINLELNVVDLGISRHLDGWGVFDFNGIVIDDAWHPAFSLALQRTLQLYRERLIAQAKAPVTMDADNAKDLNTFMNGGH